MTEVEIIVEMVETTVEILEEILVEILVEIRVEILAEILVGMVDLKGNLVEKKESIAQNLRQESNIKI
jgi:hypothetical protein